MREKKIPTVAAFIILIAVIGVLTKAYDSLIPLLSLRRGTAPENVVVTNVSDTAFTVSWLTDQPAAGAVLTNQGLDTITAFDDRDTQAVSKQDATKQDTYTSHIVSVRNLQPLTGYTFRIISAGTSYTDRGKPYEVTTGKTLEPSASKMEPAFGTVKLSSDTPAAGALVYVSLEDSQTLVAVANPSGSWIVPLHMIRTKDLLSYIPLTERITEYITIRTFRGETNAITDTLNDNPVPAMDIGKTYDFRKIQADNQAAPSQNGVTEEQKKELAATSPQADSGSVSITSPSNGSSLTTARPQFEGTGVPGRDVQLLIGISKPVSAKTPVSMDGTWRYTPDQPLSYGKQSLTITTSDSGGKPVAMTTMFDIVRGASRVLGDATESATLTPTLTMTSTPTLSPTPDVLLAGDDIPQTGVPLPLLIIMGIGIALIASGLLLAP